MRENFWHAVTLTEAFVCGMMIALAGMDDLTAGRVQAGREKARREDRYGREAETRKM